MARNDEGRPICFPCAYRRAQSAPRPGELRRYATSLGCIACGEHAPRVRHSRCPTCAAAHEWSELTRTATWQVSAVAVTAVRNDIELLLSWRAVRHPATRALLEFAGSPDVLTHALLDGMVTGRATAQIIGLFRTSFVRHGLLPLRQRRGPRYGPVQLRETARRIWMTRTSALAPHVSQATIVALRHDVERTLSVRVLRHPVTQATLELLGPGDQPHTRRSMNFHLRGVVSGSCRRSALHS